MEERGGSNRPCWGHVGSMLAHFSRLGGFFSLLAVSCAFVGRFLLMLVVFFAFRNAPGRILDRPKTISEGPKPYFSMFCRARILAMRKNSRCAKTTVFPRFLHILCKFCVPATKRRKIVPRACRTELPTKIVLKTRRGMDSRRVWRSLGRHLAGFCPLLGSSWPLLDASWASLGHFLGALGYLLVGLGSFRATF